jgi:maltooligosyltrehalose synthase
MLVGEPLRGHGRHWQSGAHLTKERRRQGLNLMRLASLMQFTLPGVPCIYYGDEAGTEGYRDPFNRSCYPWGNEEKELVEWYQRLGKLRISCSALKEGTFAPLVAGDSCIAYLRKDENSNLLCAFNRSAERKSVSVDSQWRRSEVVIGALPNEKNALILEPESCAALILKPEKPRVEELPLEKPPAEVGKTEAE